MDARYLKPEAELRRQLSAQSSRIRRTSQTIDCRLLQRAISSWPSASSIERNEASSPLLKIYPDGGIDERNKRRLIFGTVAVSSALLLPCRMEMLKLL